MATTTLTANKSSLYAQVGSTELGGGNDKHLPSGYNNGYRLRGAVDFPAPPWASMSKLTKAELKLVTTGQVHLGFGSSPDVIVRRITAAWTPNTASAGADGGGGWSASGSVWPGPAATTTGQVQVRTTTAELATVTIDVTSMVRAWAPTALGGSNAAKYGFLLLPAVEGNSGENIEFYSAKNTTSKPTLVLTYETDSPPTAPTLSTPTVLNTARPVLSFVTNDPDGDKPTSYDIEVRQGSTVVYSKTGQSSGISGMAVAHTPSSNLPTRVALTFRARSMHAGVWSPWGSSGSFTLDRDPNTPSFTAPTAGQALTTLRPTFTFSASDPDGQPIEFWSLEVYHDAGDGTPDGPFVYRRNQNTADAGGWTPANLRVTHTAVSDLPTGDLIVRARVQVAGTSGPWSAWSSYRKFSIAGDKAGITFSAPAADWRYLDVPTMADPSTNITTGQKVRVAFTVTAPTAGTVSEVRVKLAVQGTGGAVIIDHALTLLPGGGAGGYEDLIPLADATTANGKALDLTITTTTSLGAVNTRVRPCRLSYGRMTTNGFVVGPNSRNFRGSYTVVPGTSSKHYVSWRAQTTPTGGGIVGYFADIKDAEANMPAAGGYLGVMLRLVRLDDLDDVKSGFDTLSVSWESLG